MPGPAGLSPDARRGRTLSADTTRIYAVTWVAFQAWCRARDAECLPAAPRTVAAYLDACSSRLGPGGLRTVLAALGHRHRIAGQPWPGSDPLVARTMAGLKARAPRPRQAATLAEAEIRRLVATCDGPADEAAGPAACRDRALMLASFAAGLRRSELVALDHDDVRFTPQGMTLHLSARARAGGTAEVVVVRGAEAPLCAVRAMEAWLRRAGIEYGPVFVHITAAGTLEDRLTGSGVWRILRRRAALADLDVPGERVSPQALRRGFQARTA